MFFMLSNRGVYQHMRRRKRKNEKQHRRTGKWENAMPDESLTSEMTKISLFNVHEKGILIVFVPYFICSFRFNRN